ncbi:MAG: hypothetical protein COV67_02070 [Nitrospinae bacterium CG11_big_fil_rev_8_21_14_0_20_56_8]|nr:MAG: hypothetical protein COV67_02070 [Nitrospinae bacterium CG11_big_fil_rev_8_21_14_0_20_56_8]
MTRQPHAILQAMADQIPEPSRVRRMIDAGEELEAIALQAGLEKKNLIRLESGMEENSAEQTWLEDHGYEAWLKDADREERLRVIGALQMIVDISGDLDEFTDD